MNETECIAAIRASGMLSDADDVFTDARLRQELLDGITTLFEAPIASTRCGYWRKIYERTTTSGRARYRLPPRAIVGAVESVEIAERSGLRYDFQGDQIVFINELGAELAPDPDQTLRLRYLLRPSALVQTQAAGRVTAVNINSRVVTVNSLPLNRVTGVPIATGDVLDIVHQNGWHELAVVDQANSLVSGLTITFPSTVDLSDVEFGATGDFVRAADQTDWPCLPDDFIRTLCDAVAALALRSKNMLQKSDAYVAKVTKDMERFVDLLQPRVKDSPPVIKPQFGVLRGGYRRRGPRWGWP